jgi:hypothetical protein
MKTSHRRRRIAFAILAISAAGAAAVVGTVPASRGEARAQELPKPQTTQYLPSISDMMIATIQPRHRRLWQAAQQKNWAFAAYELGNLKGAFKRLGQAHPTEHDMSFSDMISSVTDQPFTELGTAIQSKDDVGFAKAYGDLTDGCNSCHQALNHGVVVIRVPRGASTSDQDFTQASP